MLRENTGALDPSSARGFGSAFGVGPSQGGVSPFQLGGTLHSSHGLPTNQGGFMQSALPGSRMVGVPGGAPQQPQQSRFVHANAPGSLPQYAQTRGSGALSAMNGIGGAANVRGGTVGGTSLGMGGPSRLGPGAGMGVLGPGVQRQGASQGMNIAGLGNPANRSMLGLGSSPVGHLGLQVTNSPGRSSALPHGFGGVVGGGMGMPGYQPSGDLLAMMGKGAAGLGGLGPGFGGQAGGLNQQGQQGQDWPTLDQSEFPALGDGAQQAGQGGLSNGDAQQGGGGLGGIGGGAEMYANISMHKGQLPSEFNIQSEEFPALPGQQTHRSDDRTSAPETSQTQQPQMGGLNRGVGGLQEQAAGAQATYGADASAPKNNEQLMRMYQINQMRPPAGMQGMGPTGAQSTAAKPAPGVPDRFGLLGLLSVIRMTDADLTTLALGTDLTTLGLHLNSPENVYKTFASPWADTPLRADPSFKPGYFSKFQQDTLFYIFYSMPMDEAQVFAADELAQRGWWFHKEFKVWLTRVPSTEPTQKNAQMERGSYFVFDTSCWECVRKDNFVLHYDALERPPNLLRPGPQPGMSVHTGLPPPPTKQ